MPFFNHIDFATIAKEMGKIIAISTPAAISGGYIWGKIFQKAREKVILKTILNAQNNFIKSELYFIWPLSTHPYKKVVDFIIEKVKDKKQNPDVNLTANFLIIEGPIGVGKTMLAHHISKKAACATYIVTASNISGPNIDQASILKSLYEEIERQKKPTIIIFDEIDVLFNTYPVLAAQFTHFFNEKAHPIYNNFLIIGTTNNRFWLHDAIRDRFQYKVSLTTPTIPDLAHFITSWAKNHQEVIDFWQIMELLLEIKLTKKTLQEKTPDILFDNTVVNQHAEFLKQLHLHDIELYKQCISSLDITNYRQIEVILDQVYNNSDTFDITTIRAAFLNTVNFAATEKTLQEIDGLWEKLIELHNDINLFKNKKSTTNNKEKIQEIKQ